MFNKPMSRFDSIFCTHPNSPELNARETLKILLRPILPLLLDHETDEIMINTPDEIYIERAGIMTRWDGQLSPRAIRSALILLARLHGHDIQEGGPQAFLDVPYGDWRICGVLLPVATRGDAVAFRRRSHRKTTVEDFCIGSDTDTPFPEEAGCEETTLPGQLIRLVHTGANILIAGGTSSGKTSLLNTLLHVIPADQRLILLEDTPELVLERSNWIRLLSHESHGVTLRLLIRHALRLRPDRLILGETRGAEAFDLIQAANTGHRGTMLTIHANGAYDALQRLETLVLTAMTGWPHEAIGRAIASAFPFVIYLRRRGGDRRIAELVHVRSYRGGTYELVSLFST